MLPFAAKAYSTQICLHVHAAPIPKLIVITRGLLNRPVISLKCDLNFCKHVPSRCEHFSFKFRAPVTCVESNL